MGSPQQCIDIDIVNDNTNEANEQFSLSLTAGQNSAIGNPGAATVTIIDDDSELYIVSLYIYTGVESLRTAVVMYMQPHQ